MALTSRDLAALVDKAGAKRAAPVGHVRPPAESTMPRLPERPTVVVEAKPTKPTQVPSSPDEDRVRGALPMSEPLTASAGAGPKTLQFTSKALKVTLVLDPAALVGVDVPLGVSRVPIVVVVGDRKVLADLSARPVRRAAATVAELGPEAVAIILQGKLEPGDVIAEAGISAVVKGPKPPPAAERAQANSDGTKG
jgi:hypothetical protein